MAKITRATIKSFIKRGMAAGNLYVKGLSRFDCMTDCVREKKDYFKVAKKDGRDFDRNTLGIAGVWLVGHKRSGGDYFQPWTDGEFEGYEISNCTGSFILARRLMLDKHGEIEQSTISATASKKQSHELKDLCQKCGNVFHLTWLSHNPDERICKKCYYGRG